jgi:type I restriction enzyme S subunit
MTTDYLFWFYRQYGNYLAFKYCQGTKQQSYTAAIIKKLPICCPEDPHEQTAIANALSDTDALIAALDKKIAKKQQIKQGAMLQLLTGKKRLPGFCRENKYKETEIGQIPEDWDVKPLDKLANIIDPHPSHRAPVEFTNGIPFLGIGDFNENGDIIKSTYRIVSKSIFTEHNLRYNLNDGLLGLGRVASIGKVIKFRNNIGEFTISPTMGVLKPTLAKRDYLFQILKSEYATQYFAKIMNGSTRSSVGMIVLRRVLIPIPKNESEQIAIAQILTDMDNEIARLEKERDKYVQLKAGMMQVLLTGKVRLVKK